MSGDCPKLEIGIAFKLEISRPIRLPDLEGKQQLKLLFGEKIGCRSPGESMCLHKILKMQLHRQEEPLLEIHVSSLKVVGSAVDSVSNIAINILREKARGLQCCYWTDY
uniref:Uncharacterized protein n=1 Tax=Sphaerodactylus townsendi TaxID=933632 RepID=A0ACB8EKD3_9SAUR